MSILFKVAFDTYSGNDFLDLFFMTFHINVILDLREVDIFPIAFRDDFIECKQEFEGVVEDIAFIARAAHVSHHTGEQVERFNVLENVGL